MKPVEAVGRSAVGRQASSPLKATNTDEYAGSMRPLKDKLSGAFSLMPLKDG